MKKDLIMLYAVLAYIAFILAIAYSVAFLGNLFVARTIDGAAVVLIGEALAVNCGLLFLFGLQHSGMARKSFKHWLHKWMSPGLERSTYVLVSSIATVTLMALWQPMGGVVWALSGTVIYWAIYALYFAGWTIMIYATYLINHFELFGLQQAWPVYRGGECAAPRLKTPGLYRHVRHPIYLGWLLVVWASPVMTVAHLVFATGMTVYMLIGIRLEERDLEVELPEYQQYKRKVPMLLPSLRKRLLTQPSFSLRTDSGAAARFARAVDQWFKEHARK